MGNMSELFIAVYLMQVKQIFECTNKRQMKLTAD